MAKYGMCVWLVDNKIVGWKICTNHIGKPLSYNTRNWQPFAMYDKFKKVNFYAPEFLNRFIFKYGHIWFRRWEHHELFKGWRAYYNKEKK